MALLGYESGISHMLVRKMCGVLEPRGPDDSGWFVGADVTLGNVASYKDSTKIAHQPLCNEDARAKGECSTKTGFWKPSTPYASVNSTEQKH